MGVPEDQGDISTELRGPNFKIDVRLNSSIPSEFKTYNQLLDYNLTSSYQQLLNTLEKDEVPSIQYDFIRTVTASKRDVDIPYHFENFCHFGSAVERLKNFKYKLKLIELYTKQINEINQISNVSNVVLASKEDINLKIEKLKTGFDGYEKFLYYTSGSLYTWPKINQTKPFNLRSITSSEAISWLGNDNSLSLSPGGQLLSASLFDRQNEYALLKLVPNHILDNPDNNFYKTFVHMIGHYFDGIWTHIKALTDVNNSHHTRGISKDLVYHQLKSFGIETFDQFENTNLIEYILGHGTGSSTFYDAPPNQTLVTASNEGSVPKGDIIKEIWKRLYHNAPYLLKTKGTERGIKALMSCYGIPSTILNIKESAGSTSTTGQPLRDIDLADFYKTFSYDKSSLALTGYNLTNGYFLKSNWSSSLTDALSASAKTIEVRIKPRHPGTYNNHIISLQNTSDLSNDVHLVIQPYVGNSVSSSNDAETYGRLTVLQGDGTNLDEDGKGTSYFPIYNGDFWTVYMGIEGASGSLNVLSGQKTIKFGAYQSNFNKNVAYYNSQTVQISESQRALTFGDPFYNSGAQIGGAQKVFVGGVPTNATYPTAVDIALFSGSMQELRYYFGELLSHTTLKKHALDPLIYGGNNVTSSFEHLVFRSPMGSNDMRDTSSFHPNREVDYIFSGSIQSQLASPGAGGSLSRFQEVVQVHHHLTPDTVGIAPTSEKVRIDEGTVFDNLLSPNIKGETSTLDRQPLDNNTLGVFFSPTTEINEDIVYTLGAFRLDDYIGDPSLAAANSPIYTDLKELRDIYYKKVKRKYNFWDYIKLIQQIDHTLFKVIEQFSPAKANLKTGLLIEPTYLERNKIAKPGFFQRDDGQTMTTGLHSTFEFEIDGPKSERIHHIFTISGSNEPQGLNTGKQYTYHNNFSRVTSSRTGERTDRGTNTTIHLDDFWPTFDQDACQAPIRPFTNIKPHDYIQRVSSVLLGNAIIGRKSNIYYRKRNPDSLSESDY